MKFTPTDLTGAFLVDLQPIQDDRGFFARSWCAREFAAQGLDARLLQCNVSFNEKAGTLRGMHYQQRPHGEAKLVTCWQGAIFDVIVDVRPSSATYLHWYAVELSAENRRSLYVPEGFAHGFQTLRDETLVGYQMSEFFYPESAAGLRWNDPRLAISWPAVTKRIVSPKDEAYALL